MKVTTDNRLLVMVDMATLSVVLAQEVKASLLFLLLGSDAKMVLAKRSWLSRCRREVADQTELPLCIVVVEDLDGQEKVKDTHE